jgi:hypothetical protein
MPPVDGSTTRKKPMTFEEFQATRKQADDLGAVIGYDTVGRDDGEVVAGFHYHGGLHIFASDEGGFDLAIGNTIEANTSLEALERKLYAWGKDEGVID